MTDTQLLRAVDAHLQSIADRRTLTALPRKCGKTYALAVHNATQQAALRRDLIAKGRRRMQGED